MLSKVWGRTSFTVMIAAASGGAAFAETAWTPKRPIELVAQSAPGSGTDITARMIQEIWRTQKIVSVSSSVVNKAGGNGSVALSYLQHHAGDGHYLEVASAALLTSQITGTSPFHVSDFTVIAKLASEYLAFAIKADSPIKDGKDLMARLKGDPGSLSIAIGTAAGGVNNVAAALVTRAAGGDPKKLKTVVFSSSSESATALLGGHVDLVVASASEVLPFLRDGRMRLIGITAPQRQDGPLANVPTWKEHGVDIVIDNFRPVIGPPKLSPAEVSFWDAVFIKTTASDQWKADVQKSHWSGVYLASADARKYIDDQYKILQLALEDLGMAK